MGLVGCGEIAAAVHMPVLRRLRSAQLVAVADPAPEGRRRAEGSRGIEVGDSPAWLIGRGDLDAVVVCSPSASHAEVTTAAAEAGLHVYVEKPMATTMTAALEVVDAASLAGVTVAIGFNRRLHPLHVRGRELLRQGAIGRVHSVSCSFGEPIPPESMPGWKQKRVTGGGVLLDLASHHFDLVRWLLDTEIVEVEASLSSELSEDDAAQLRLRTSDDVTVEGSFSFRSPRSDRLDFVGDLGTLRIDRYGWALELVRHRDGSPTRRRLPPSWLPSVWRAQRIVSPENDPSWRRALAAFVAHVRDGTRSELAGPTDGLRSLEVVLAAEESARLSETVTLAATASASVEPRGV